MWTRFSRLRCVGNCQALRDRLANHMRNGMVWGDGTGEGGDQRLISCAEPLGLMGLHALKCCQRQFEPWAMLRQVQPPLSMWIEMAVSQTFKREWRTDRVF